MCKIILIQTLGFNSCSIMCRLGLDIVSVSVGGCRDGSALAGAVSQSHRGDRGCEVGQRRQGAGGIASVVHDQYWCFDGRYCNPPEIENWRSDAVCGTRSAGFRRIADVAGGRDTGQR